MPWLLMLADGFGADGDFGASGGDGTSGIGTSIERVSRPPTFGWMWTVFPSLWMTMSTGFLRSDGLMWTCDASQPVMSPTIAAPIRITKPSSARRRHETVVTHCDAPALNVRSCLPNRPRRSVASLANTPMSSAQRFERGGPPASGRSVGPFIVVTRRRAAVTVRHYRTTDEA